MNLFLIRHGESTNNALTDISQRVADPELTATRPSTGRAGSCVSSRGVAPHPVRARRGSALF